MDRKGAVTISTFDPEPSQDFEIFILSSTAQMEPCVSLYLNFGSEMFLSITNHKASTLQDWRDQIVQGRRFYRTDSTKGCSVAGLRKESLDRNVAPQILASRIIQVHTKMSWRIGCGKHCLNWVDKPKRMRLNQSPAVVNLDAEAMESALCGVGRGKWISTLLRNSGI